MEQDPEKTSQNGVPYVSIVIPAYNEETTVQISIPIIIGEITKSNRYHKTPFLFEVIVIDDGSEDKTLTKLLDLKSEYPFLRILKMTGNHGHMQALESGMRSAKGKWIVTMDVDLQDPPSYIGDMIQLAEEENLECVQTVRKNRNKDSFLKKVTANLFYKTMAILTGVKVIPHAADFRLLSNEVVQELLNSPEINKIFRFLIPEMHLEMKTLEIVRDKRVSGSSKYPYIKMITFALDSIFGFSKRPLRIISLAGFIISAFFSIFAISLIIFWISFQNYPVWILLFAFMLIGNALIIASVAAIGEYISRIYLQTMKRSTLRFNEIFS
jgi:polyisoprenyl-phosphate glycosyltransferase